MSKFWVSRVAFGCIPLLILLAGCNLPQFIPAEIDERGVESEIGSPEAATSEPQVVPSATESVRPSAGETSAPPTASPPEMGDTLEVPKLASGTELTIVRIKMLNASAGWAVGGAESDPRRILRTSDGGRTWQEVTPPLRQSLDGDAFQVTAWFRDDQAAQVIRFDPVNRQGEASGSVLVVWRTEDGGASWQASDPLRVPFIAFNRAEPYWDYGNPQAGWILARRGGVGMHQHPVALLRTVDGGTQWTLQHGPFDTPGPGLMGCTKSGMDFGSGDVGLLTISDCPIDGAELLSTVDGGDSWQSQQLPAPAGYEEQYAAAAGGGCQSHSPHVLSNSAWRVGVLCRVFDEAESRYAFLFSSEDAGVSWQAIEAPEGELEFLSPEQGWVLGRDIYRTTDGGQSWQQRKTVFWDGQFSFVDMQLGWAVARADDGQIALVVSEDGAETWQIIEPVVE